MAGDTGIRRLTLAAVLLVAGIAAVVSFIHIQHLAVTHGQEPLAAALLPVSIDGTVAAASLAMVHAARMRLPAPALARLGLVLSVGATLAANIGYGLAFGTVGALVSGWPAVAFIVCAEISVGMLRRAAPAGPPQQAPEPVQVTVPSTAMEAAESSLRATLAAGNPMSVNQLQERFSLTRSAATKLRREVLAAANGHASGELAASPDRARNRAAQAVPDLP